MPLIFRRCGLRWIQSGGRTNDKIQRHCDDRNCQPDNHCNPAFVQLGNGDCGAWLNVLGHTSFKLLPGSLVSRLVDGAGRQIGVQFTQLIAQHRQIDFIAQRMSIHHGIFTQHGWQNKEQSARHQQGSNNQKYGHFVSFKLELARRSAAARCISASGNASTCGRPRRNFKPRNPMPPINSRNGPNHSSQVVALTGGR